MEDTTENIVKEEQDTPEKTQTDANSSSVEASAESTGADKVSSSSTVSDSAAITTKAVPAETTATETETPTPSTTTSSSSTTPAKRTNPTSGSNPRKKLSSKTPSTRGIAVAAPSSAELGLSIPYRTVKKAMKLDPDVVIVQNEAALVVTKAAELFLQSLAEESLKISKNHGRSTIRYEDVAEARSNDASLAFLKTLLP